MKILTMILRGQPEGGRRENIPVNIRILFGLRNLNGCTGIGGVKNKLTLRRKEAIMIPTNE